MFSSHSDQPSSMTHLKKQVLFLVSLLSASFILTTTLFWIYEQHQAQITSFIDVAWWWFVTSATVGYGDLVPYSTAGRIAGVIAIVIGLFGYTHIIGLILQFIQHKFEEEERGRGSVDFQDHIVICEYTAFADELIQEIKEDRLFQDREIVIVGSLVNRTPYAEHSFIYGEPISPAVLQRSNISQAGAIFVFSNNRFSDPDTKTLHVVSRIKKLNQHAPLYVELHNPDHPLLDKLDGEITVMKSSDMLHNAIKHQFIDVNQYLED
ncbi:TrkA-N domain-containing protein [Fodinibius salinus]|uniref:TrkA-N domain-containing protein n=1 Tax=Fodinibius salinus TaxID=860790 RepID=A0A5D3YNZ9_9BACT|nr:ion channel [Fodinibius salinus]TYP95422.1 TrkA-N domain-containing protein [Fodinibius salinus]